MNIPLSSRLLTCCSFVRPGDRVADIGCDHGYLGIYLLKNHIASEIIAADINEGPLQSAVLNCQRYGAAEKIRFFLSDGARNIPRDFDVMICAGMGADTIVSILSAAPWLKSASYRLILQCQSKTPMLRQFLSENGWSINAERLVRDGRFLYTVMDVHFASGTPLSPAGWHFPYVLLDNPQAEVSEYLGRVIGKLSLATAHQDNPQLSEILHSLKTDPMLKEVLYDNR